MVRAPGARARSQRAGLSNGPPCRFTTRSLPVYQHWEIPGTKRYCLYRPYSPITAMTASPSFPLWDDADVQLMVDPHPSISAITVGRYKSAQKAPQCMAPQCGAERYWLRAVVLACGDLTMRAPLAATAATTATARMERRASATGLCSSDELL